MKLTDYIIVNHLEQGGKIRLPPIHWAYVRLDNGQLFWADAKMDSLISCVESFVDIISKDWEIFNAHPVHRRDLPETL